MNLKVLFFVFVGHLECLARPCPIQDCLCYPASPEPSSRILDCRNIPKILHTAHALTTNELFYEITFRNSNLSELSEGDLRGLRTKRLDLGGNKIQSIHSRTFAGLKFDLIYIYLEGDGKAFIPFHSLHSLKSLRTLVLVNFALHYIDNSVSFLLLPNLKHLSLINTGTTFFSSYTFDSNANRLTEFQFCDNPKVSTFPVGAMRNLFYVQKLVWTGNGMTVIPAHAFRDLAHLEDLDISENELNKIETHSFSGVTDHIRQLNLSRNKLTSHSILQEFSRTQWITLQYLNLSYNFIDHLEEAIFKKMEKLLHLDLSSNGLQSISASNFQHLHHLQRLDLSRNSLHSVDIKAFTWTKSLSVLDLHHQVTEKQEMDFTNAHDNSVKLSIKKIILSHTRLRDSNFWQLLQRLSYLKHLHAAHSGLSVLIPGGFRQTKLTHVSLHHNDIYELFPDTFSGLEDSLEILNLRNNRLNKLDELVVKNLRSLKVIDISLNRIECNCSMQWFLKWLKLNSKEDSVLEHLKHGYDLKCSNLSEGGDTNFETAMSDLKCENDTRRNRVNSTSAPLTSPNRQLSSNWLSMTVIFISAFLPTVILALIVFILISNPRSRPKRKQCRCSESEITDV